MSTKSLANSFGIASVLLSSSFWFAFLPQWLPGVRLIHWGIATHMALWGGAFLLSLIPAAKASRWWIVATILPFLNLIFLVFVIAGGEWMSSRPN